MIDSMNPKIQNELIRQNAASGGGGSSDLPDIGPGDYGSYLAVDELGEWGLDRPKTGIDYSTQEQNTGLKWIDGKEIFQKSGQGKMTSSIVITENVDTLVNSYGSYQVDQNKTMFPLGAPVSNTYNILVVKDNLNQLLLYRGNGSSELDYNYTAFYTKQTETKKSSKKK